MSLQRIQENVLIPAGLSRKFRTSDLIIKKAQSHAKKMIKEAAQECDAIQNEAYRTGYERGLLASIDSVCQFIDNSSKYAYDLYLKIQGDINELLSDLLDGETVLLKILDSWIDGLDKSDKQSPLCILMPYASRRFRNSLTRVAESKYAGAVVFEYHHDPRFVFKYKDKLAEFHPEEFIYSTVNTLTGKIPFHYDCQHISAKAIQHLHDQLSFRYKIINDAVEPVEHNNGETNEYQ